MVCCSFSPANPGAINGTRIGAASHATPARITRPTVMRLAIVETMCHARLVRPVSSCPATMGTSAAATVPAATSWKIRSGMRNAASNASDSGPAPSVLPMTATRT